MVHGGKTLQELEDFDWGVRRSDDYFEPACFELRRKPIDEFTTEELILMIRWSIGLRFLIPLALERLAKASEASAGFDARGLWTVVLTIDICYWHENREQWAEVEAIIRETRLRDEAIHEELVRAAQELRRALRIA